MRKYLMRSVCVGVIMSLGLNFHTYSQETGQAELFRSIENQEVELLKQYSENNNNLDLYNYEGQSLMYVAVDNWNLPAIEILLENNSSFSYQKIKKLLGSKIDAREQLSISKENYRAHHKVKTYIEPFESYKVVNNREPVEDFSPALSPPSYNELKQIFNKAKPQFDLMLARRVQSGLNTDLDYAGLSTGAGIMLPLFKNYSSQLTCGEKNISVREEDTGKTIYLNNDVYQLDQLDIQQLLRQRFSLYFHLMGIYNIRMTGMLPDNPDFIGNITSEDYLLDIRSIDISPSLVFKYGIFYFKSGMEIRKNLKTSVLWPRHSNDGDLENADISEFAQPISTAVILSAGVDVLFAYVEFGRSFGATDFFQGISSEVNWSGFCVGVRL